MRPFPRPIVLLAVLAAACLSSSACLAQTLDSAATGRLETLTTPVNETPFLNGGVLVATRREPAFVHVDGFADFASGERNTRNSVFQTASASKPFTSVAVLQLRDRGRIDLDAPVTRYLDGFPFAEITVRHLLTHTSALPDLELYEGLVASDPDRVIGSADVVPALQAWTEPLPFRAGERFRYSNTNYQLLARIVERVSGERFGAYLRRHVFAPAGMRSTYVIGDRPPRGEPRAPVANQVLALMFWSTPRDVRDLQIPDPRAMRPFRYEGFNLGSTVGDQNVFTTLDDLAAFDRALRAGHVLSLVSQAEAYAPVRLNDGAIYRDEEEYQVYGVACSYGMGWEICDHPRYGRIVGHVGYNRGISVLFYRNLDRGQMIAAYDNGDTGEFSARAASVARVLNGDAPLEISRTRSATRAYGVALASGDPTSALVRFNQLRGDPEAWGFSEAGLNRLGYDLLRNGHPDLAVEPFRMNIILNPASANAYDSLGEVLVASGRGAEAVAAYQRSLELNPDNVRGSEALARLRAETVDSPGLTPAR